MLTIFLKSTYKKLYYMIKNYYQIAVGFGVPETSQSNSKGFPSTISTSFNGFTIVGPTLYINN